MDGALELALREVDQYNLDLGVFQDTKVTDGIHMRASAVYCVFVTNTLSRNRRGGVAIFYQDAPHFKVKALQLHGPNMLGSKVASGGQH